MNRMKMKMSYLWIVIWCLFLVCLMNEPWVDLLSNKGLHLINGEYYRFVTSLFLHVNIFHMFLNAITMTCLDIYIDHYIKAWHLFIISLFGGIITNFIFSYIYPEMTSVGGSPAIFVLLGLICIMYSRLPVFQILSKYSLWLIVYIVFGQVPIYVMNMSTLVIHLIAFCIGMTSGMIYKKWIFKESMP